MIPKYALCLQEGRILKGRKRFVGVLLTSCKTNDPPRRCYWTVYLPPAECNGAQYGVEVDCGEIHTIPFTDVTGYAYMLNEQRMAQVNEALMFGIGAVKMEQRKVAYQAEAAAEPAKNQS